MTKDQILEQLKNDAYVRLATTEHGIGVVAIKPIPAGTDVFKGCMQGIGFLGVAKVEIDELEEPLRKLVVDFCPLQDDQYWLPDSGIESIDKSYYLNHSNTPNMMTPDGGEIFITTRDIKVGEELVVDYNTYDDQEEDFK